VVGGFLGRRIVAGDGAGDVADETSLDRIDRIFARAIASGAVAD
jgi:hypothetical protein